jgi:hypothetical protein
MEQGNLYLVRNFSATRSKITIDATTSASEDLFLSLFAHFHENGNLKQICLSTRRYNFVCYLWDTTLI